MYSVWGGCSILLGWSCMPTYEYECTNCGHTFEIIQSFSDKPRSRCSECRGKLRKLFHPAGIIFRGSGWYATDSRASTEKDRFKSDGKKSEPETGEPAVSGPQDSPDSKPESTSTKSEAVPEKSKEDASSVKSSGDA